MNGKERILAAVKRIPKGRVSSYASVAKRARSSPRAVGAVMHANRDINVPCHRVVCSDKTVGGFNRGVAQKIRLLRSEGVRIEGGKVVGGFSA